MLIRDDRVSQSMRKFRSIISADVVMNAAPIGPCSRLTGCDMPRFVRTHLPASKPPRLRWPKSIHEVFGSIFGHLNSSSLFSSTESRSPAIMTSVPKRKQPDLSQILVEGFPEVGNFEDIPKVRKIAGPATGPYAFVSQSYNSSLTTR